MNQSRSRGPRKGPRRNNTSSRRRTGRRTFSSHRGPRRSARKQPTFDPTQFINKNPVEVKEEVYVPKHRFADFAIDGRLKETLAANGLTWKRGEILLSSPSPAAQINVTFGP